MLKLNRAPGAGATKSPKTRVICYGQHADYRNPLAFRAGTRPMTRKSPPARQPFDPAKAARERAALAAPQHAPTTPTRVVRKAGLRPLPPARPGSDE